MIFKNIKIKKRPLATYWTISSWANLAPRLNSRRPTRKNIYNNSKLRGMGQFFHCRHETRPGKSAGPKRTSHRRGAGGAAEPAAGSEPAATSRRVNPNPLGSLFPSPPPLSISARRHRTAQAQARGGRGRRLVICRPRRS